MFINCSNMVEAPELPAAGLVGTIQAYIRMFYNCSKLNYVKCLADIDNASDTSEWLYGVASTGTFVKSASATDWPSGVDGIPTGWTVVDV